MDNKRGVTIKICKKYDGGDVKFDGCRRIYCK